MLVNYSLFKRNDCIVCDVNVFWTHLRAALSYVAQSETEFILEQFSSRETIERMHLQPGNANEETRAAKLFLLVVIAQNMTNILAKKTLDALTKFLYSIDIALIHFPSDIGARSKRWDLLVNLIIP